MTQGEHLCPNSQQVPVKVLGVWIQKPALEKTQAGETNMNLGTT